MLEPAVRPGSSQGVSPVGQGKPAFEQRSFSDLLDEAQQDTPTQGKAGQPDQARSASPLEGLGQIENAAVRRVLAQAQQVGDPLGEQAV